MKKNITIFLFIILLIFIFFDKKIIEYLVIKNFKSITGHELNLNIDKITYSSGKINIKDFKVINKKFFFNKYVFEAKEVNIGINIKSFFRDLVLINYLYINEPKFYFDIKINQNIDKNKDIEDNINLIDTIKAKNNPKKYSIKNKDKNFFINTLKINTPFVYIKSSKNKKNITIKLSDMNFKNVGNASKIKESNFQHFKDVFRIILTLIYFKIPDEDLRNMIKKNYKIN